MRPSPRDDTAAPLADALTPELLRAWPLPSDPAADKHDRGTVLVVAGSERTPGAALLAGTAALRAGAGRLQMATVEASAPALGAAIPEALVQGLPATGAGAPDPEAAVAVLAGRIKEADTLLVGPGFDDLRSTRALLAGLLLVAGPDILVVLDALALRALPGVASAVIRPLAGRLAFTPNREEALSLVPEGSSDLEDGALVASAARDHGAAVTMAGHVAAADGRRWVAGTAVPGLGTSGSGDVLAGLVAGSAARCGDAAQAACWGTYLHVAAGARLGERIGRVGYLARELLDEVPGLMEDATPDLH